jgi:heat shock protein HslJ
MTKQTADQVSVSTTQETEVSNETPTTYDIIGLLWRLSEIKKGMDVVYVDRTQLEVDGMGDVYTLRFADGNVTGKGTSNNFRAPYNIDGASLSIEAAAQTLMATIKESAVLRENEFFDYLTSVSSWSLVHGILTLVTVDVDGNETVLSFVAE